MVTSRQVAKSNVAKNGPIQVNVFVLATRQLGKMATKAISLTEPQN